MQVGERAAGDNRKRPPSRIALAGGEVEWQSYIGLWRMCGSCWWRLSCVLRRRTARYSWRQPALMTESLGHDVTEGLWQVASKNISELLKYMPTQAQYRHILHQNCQSNCLPLHWGGRCITRYCACLHKRSMCATYNTSNYQSNCLSLLLQAALRCDRSGFVGKTHAQGTQYIPKYEGIYIICLYSCCLAKPPGTHPKHPPNTPQGGTKVSKNTKHRGHLPRYTIYSKVYDIFSIYLYSCCLGKPLPNTS